MSKDSPTPPSNQLSGVRCTLKSALQSAFQICTVLFDKPRDAFTQTLDRLGELNEAKFVMSAFSFVFLTKPSLLPM